MIAPPARIALSACFLAGGLGLGAWGANLPALSRRADLTEGELGLMLLCFAAGAMLSMSNAPRMIKRLGALRLAVISGGLFGIVMTFVGLAQSMTIAIGLAVALGISFGTLDVTMNKAAASLEVAARRPMMSSFHAIFSIGTLVSAAGYTALLHGGASIPLSIGLAGAAAAGSAGLGGWLARRVPLEATESRAAQSGGHRQHPDLRSVLILGGMAFLAFLAEGALMDWAGVYLVRVLGSAESTGAFGFTIFVFMLAMGRLIGDWANLRIGSVRLFKISAATVAVATAAMLAVPGVPLTFVALACAGFGVANVIPVIFSSAGRLATADDGRTMSRVLIMAYSGLLVGPALIGFIAQAISLSVGLWFVVLAMVAVTLGGSFLGGILGRR